MCVCLKGFVSVCARGIERPFCMKLRSSERKKEGKREVRVNLVRQKVDKVQKKVKIKTFRENST